MTTRLDPYITSIEPSTVQQSSTFTLTVLGRNFDDKCIVMIDGVSGTITLNSAERLDSLVDSMTTGTAGEKSVKVHQTVTGNLSNEAKLRVVPK